MAKVEFIYNGESIIIQCLEEDKMEDIIGKFLGKCQKQKGSVYLLYAGKILDEDLTFNEVATRLDKSNKLMKVQALDLIFNVDQSVTLKKSNYIICPKCKEKAKISVDENYQISLYECKNGHKKSGILLKEFEETQLIDESKIKCDACKKEKKSDNTNFFSCCTCKLNLCPKCKNKHDKEHLIVNYNDKDFYCNTHKEKFIGYCLDCKKDLCSLCKIEHSSHKNTLYDNAIPDIDTFKKELVRLKESIRNLRVGIKKIIEKLNYVIENLNHYYEIYNNIINSFDKDKLNYLYIQNIKDLKDYNIHFIQNITEITKDQNLKTKFKDLYQIYEKMIIKEKVSKIIDDIDKGLAVNFDFGEVNYGENVDDSPDEEDNEQENIITFNHGDNDYKNLVLKNLKEIQSYKVKNKVKDLMVLHDRRLLVHQQYKDEEDEVYNNISIYDLNNTMICDISHDIKRKVQGIFQMDDNNIIISVVEPLNYMIVFKVKKKSIKEIYREENVGYDIYRLLNDKFLSHDFGFFNVYLYEDSKIDNYGDSFKIDDVNSVPINVNGINEDEIAIYYVKDGKIYGKNAFIKFYDIENNKDIKIIKIGNYLSGKKMLLFNDNNLIVENNNNLILIDTKNKTIIKQIMFAKNEKLYGLMSLNDRIVFAMDKHSIYQYEIKNNQITLIESKKKESDFNIYTVNEYPENKFIVARHDNCDNNEKLAIYGY